MTAVLASLENRFLPLRDGVADFCRMVFLQVVKARAMYHHAVGQFFREAIRKDRRDQHTRISAEEQLRYPGSEPC